MTTHVTTARSAGARRSTASRGPAGRPGLRRSTVARRATVRPPRARPAAASAAAADCLPRVLLGLAFLGAMAVVSLPGAATASASFGWLPLWLPGLPATAWLALAWTRRYRGG